MLAAHVYPVAAIVLLSQSPLVGGRITGRVVNSTRGDVAVGAAEVLLRVNVDGEFQVVERTIADQEGRFAFEGLPLDQELVYLPGANQDDIHYPGPRIRLTSDRTSADVVLKVQDAFADANPLLLDDYEIVVEPQPGFLRVTETMWIENPGVTTFVGRKPHESAPPVTLRLCIPPEFERVTFREEFYGRQFSMVNDKLVTTIPWTPGRRKLEFTYVLRNDAARWSFDRALDLLCRHVRLTVRAGGPDGVTCSLGAPLRTEEGSVTFESTRTDLPAGQAIHLELNRLPIPVMAYARWAILGVLVLAISTTCVLLKWKRTVGGRPASARQSPRLEGRERRRGLERRSRAAARGPH